MSHFCQAGSTKSGPTRAFTLMEMMVSFAMLVILLVAILVIFERSARIGRDQSEIAAIQQSSRIAHSEMIRHIRMAGAGGLPLTWKNLPKSAVAADIVKVDTPGAFPNGFAVAIRNNTAEGVTMPIGTTGGTTHLVLPGSDMLTIRGAFSLPVYFYYPAVQTNPTNAALKWKLTAGKLTPPAPLEIPNRIGKDFRTSLKPLIDHLTKMKNESKPVLFVVRDLMNPDAYGVLKWDSDNGGNDLTIKDCTTVQGAAGTQGAFDVGCIHVAVEAIPTERYAKLMLGTALEPGTGSIDLPMAGVPRNAVAFPYQFGSIAVLQEYRYYVRADFEVPGDPTSRLSPVLTRTEYLPSTELDPLRADFVETVDVVDNLIDLQVAVGIDKDWSISAVGHGVVTDSGSVNDEILFNFANDFPGDAPPLGLAGFDGRGDPNYIRWFHPKLDVYFLRLSTIAQSQRPERDFAGAGLGMIEDCDRTANFKIGATTYNFNNDRKYRRRLLQSVAELRNLK